MLMVSSYMTPSLSNGLWAWGWPPEHSLGRRSGSGGLPHPTPADGVPEEWSLVCLPGNGPLQPEAKW